MRNLLSVKLFLCSAALTGTIFCLGTTDVSAETNVNAVVCGADSQPSLSITSPASDSLLDATTVRLKGTVRHATTIDVQLDGVYNSTIALTPNQTTYEFDVSVSPGTHTVRLTSYGICSATSVTADIVITIVSRTDPTPQPDPDTPIDTPIAPTAPINTDERELASDDTNVPLADPQTVIPGLDGTEELLDRGAQPRSGVVRPIDVAYAAANSQAIKAAIEYSLMVVFVTSFAALVFSSSVASFFSAVSLSVSRSGIIVTALVMMLVALTASV